MRNRGVKWDGQSRHKSLFVLRDTCKKMTAVLLEIGFLTNAADAKKLGNKHVKHVREALSQALAKEIFELIIN